MRIESLEVSGFRAFSGQEVFDLDADAVLVPEKVFEEDLQRKGQPLGLRIFLIDGGETMNRVILIVDA